MGPAIEAKLAAAKTSLQTGKFSEAEAALNAVLESEPQQFEAVHLMGVAKLIQGQLDPANEFFLKAIEIDPNSVKALNNLGIVHKARKNYESAVQSFQRAADLDSDDPEISLALGDCLFALGRLDEAASHFHRTVEIDPDNDRAHNNLAIILNTLGQKSDALIHLRKAIDINPDDADAHSNLGTLLSEMGEQDDAVTHFRKAIELNPGHAKAHCNLGTTLSELGRLEEGTAHFRKAIEADPDFAEAHRQLTFSKARSDYNGDVQAMEDIFNQVDTPEEQKMHLAFGLGKSFEDMESYEKAFGFFSAGNAIKRKSYDFDLEKWDTYFRKIRETFDTSLFDRYEGSGCTDETPIFVLGMPRSGTTLIEQILASHGDVYAAGELDTFSRAIAASFDEKTYPGNVVDSKGGDFASVGHSYVEEIRKKSGKERFITDKLPHNFLHLGMIRLALPNAKVIHCKRDARDTCLSIFKTYFTSQDHTYAYDQIELGHYYNLYADLMQHWADVLPGFIHNIQYEDVVTDQEAQTKALLELCDLDWDDACLEFYKAKRAVKTASAVQVRQPIYKGSVQSWKRYEAQLAPLLGVLQ